MKKNLYDHQKIKMEFSQDQESTGHTGPVNGQGPMTGITCNIHTVDPRLGPEHRKLMVDGKSNMVRFGFILMSIWNHPIANHPRNLISPFESLKLNLIGQKIKPKKVISRQFRSLWNFN